MANPSREDLVRKAICAGFRGHITWKESAYNNTRDDPDLDGNTPEYLQAILREFVRDQNGKIDVRSEKRPEYLNEDPDNPFWYRVIAPVPELEKNWFFELVIMDYDEDEPWVEIVSSHRNS